MNKMCYCSTCADEFVLDSSTILSVSIFIMFDAWIVWCMWFFPSSSSITRVPCLYRCPMSGSCAPFFVCCCCLAPLSRTLSIQFVVDARCVLVSTIYDANAGVLSADDEFAMRFFFCTFFLLLIQLNGFNLFFFNCFFLFVAFSRCRVSCTAKQCSTSILTLHELDHWTILNNALCACFFLLF